MTPALQQEFIDDILEEREAQDKQWGGPHHDDTHSYQDWLRFIRQQLGSVLIVPGGDQACDDAMKERKNLLAFERRMVKVAALAMAAVESAKRKAKK